MAGSREVREGGETPSLRKRGKSLWLSHFNSKHQGMLRFGIVWTIPTYSDAITIANHSTRTLPRLWRKLRLRLSLSPHCHRVKLVGHTSDTLLDGLLVVSSWKTFLHSIRVKTEILSLFSIYVRSPLCQRSARRGGFVNLPQPTHVWKGLAVLGRVIINEAYVTVSWLANILYAFLTYEVGLFIPFFVHNAA